MKMKEYGSENHPTILLLCKKEPKNEGWNSLIHALEEQYHILLPSLNDTYQMQTQYAKALHDITQYVSTHYAGRIYAVYGLSDSCGLLLAMLRQGKIHSSKTIIESDGCPPGYFAFSLLPPKSYSERSFDLH